MALIAPAVDPARGTVEVRLAVPAPPPVLRADMTVSINVDVGRKGRGAGGPGRGRPRPDRRARGCWPSWAGAPQRRAVTLGLRGDGLVEIAAGLAAGDAVVAPAAGFVAPGERVRARPLPAPREPAMPFELFVALRFLREGKAQTALILGGTTIGVAVIIFLSALIGGLQATLIDQTLSSQAHVFLKRPDRVARVVRAAGRRGGGGPGGEDAGAREVDRAVAGAARPRIRATPGVMAATPTAAGSAFAARGELSKSVALRGLDPQTFDSVIRHRSRASRPAASAWRGPRR